MSADSMEHLTKRFKLAAINPDPEAPAGDEKSHKWKAVEEHDTVQSKEEHGEEQHAEDQSPEDQSPEDQSPEGQRAEEELTDEEPIEENSLNGNSNKLCLEFSKTLTVLVGPEEIEFVVHPIVMCARSGWFKIRGSPEWSQGDNDRPARLADYDPETFNEYLKFVHGLASTQEELTDDSEANDARLKNLVSIYALATYLMDDRAANAVMDLFAKLVKESPNGALPSPAIVAAVCECLSDIDPMSVFMADCFICYATPLEMEMYRKEVPADFFYSVAVGWTIQMESARTTAEVTGNEFFTFEVKQELPIDTCHYHRHHSEFCPAETCSHHRKVESFEAREDGEEGDEE